MTWMESSSLLSITESKAACRPTPAISSTVASGSNRNAGMAVLSVGQLGHGGGEEVDGGGVRRDELGFQRVHQGHQFVHLGHDPTLFGEGGDKKFERPYSAEIQAWLSVLFHAAPHLLLSKWASEKY